MEGIKTLCQFTRLFSEVYQKLLDTISFFYFKVLMDGVGHISYVANSPWTVIGESYSADRLYDRIGDTDKGKVKFITARGILCTLKKDKSKGDASPDEIGQEFSAQSNGDK